MTPGSSRLPDLGPRGEGWLAIQLALFAAIVGLAFARVYWPESAADELTVIGIIAIAAGIALFLLALVSAGAALSPFPRPKRNAGHSSIGRLSHGAPSDLRSDRPDRARLVARRIAARLDPHSVAGALPRPQGPARRSMARGALSGVRGLPAQDAPALRSLGVLGGPLVYAASMRGSSRRTHAATVSLNFLTTA